MSPIREKEMKISMGALMAVVVAVLMAAPSVSAYYSVATQWEPTYHQVNRENASQPIKPDMLPDAALGEKRTGEDYSDVHVTWHRTNRTSPNPDDWIDEVCYAQVTYYKVNDQNHIKVKYAKDWTNNNILEGVVYGRNPAIAYHDGYVYIVSEFTEGLGGYSAIQLITIDATQTQPVLRLKQILTDNDVLAYNPDVTVTQDGKIHIVWQQYDNGLYKIYYERRSGTLGDIVEIHDAVISQGNAIFANYVKPTIDHHGNDVCVAFTEDQTNGDSNLYYEAIDYKSTQSNIIYIDNGYIAIGATGETNEDSDIYIYGDNAYVAWEYDNQSANTQIHFTKFLWNDHNTGFSAPGEMGNSTLDSLHPRIKVNQDTDKTWIHITFDQQIENAAPNDPTYIWYARWDDSKNYKGPLDDGPSIIPSVKEGGTTLAIGDHPALVLDTNTPSTGYVGSGQARVVWSGYSTYNPNDTPANNDLHRDIFIVRDEYLPWPL